MLTRILDRLQHMAGWSLIALAAAMRLQAGQQQPSMAYAFDVKPRWPLDQL